MERHWTWIPHPATSPGHPASSQSKDGTQTPPNPVLIPDHTVRLPRPPCPPTPTMGPGSGPRGAPDCPVGPFQSRPGPLCLRPLTASGQAARHCICGRPTLHMCPEQAKHVRTGSGWWGEACLEREAGRPSGSSAAATPFLLEPRPSQSPVSPIPAATRHPSEARAPLPRSAFSSFTDSILRFPGGAAVKNLPASAADARDGSWTPGLGRSHGVGNGNLLQ